LRDSEGIIMDDVSSEPNAAGAEDAAFVIQDNARAEVEKRLSAWPYSTEYSWSLHSPA
jgi:hypothetical protein